MHQAFQLPLDLTSQEYQKLIDKNTFNYLDFNLDSETSDLQKILELGKRNLEWLKFINQNKENPNAPDISFSSSETQKGYPIEKPSIYNYQIIMEQYKNLFLSLPTIYKKILIENQTYTKTPPEDIKDYIKNGLAIDHLYQTAARWILLKPYLNYLEENKYNDIRGYYYFKKIHNIENQFQNFRILPIDQQNEIRSNIWLLCLNSKIEKDECEKFINDEISKFNNLSHFYENHFKTFMKFSEGIYNLFFDIPVEVKRNDIKWTSNGSTFLTTVPFQFVEDQAIENFLKKNIEEEWAWKNWNLKLDFEKNADIHIEFEEGTTPHVNGLGGNTIVMDANAPLTEYDVQWTIRHEFGHVLGFPDCYLEFYDDSTKAIIGYQIDTTDLMCSRQGHIKQRHFDELKKIYSIE